MHFKNQKSPAMIIDAFQTVYHIKKTLDSVPVPKTVSLSETAGYLEGELNNFFYCQNGKDFNRVAVKILIILQGMEEVLKSCETNPELVVINEDVLKLKKLATVLKDENLIS